jgi:hypothetical protein
MERNDLVVTPPPFSGHFLGCTRYQERRFVHGRDDERVSRGERRHRIAVRGERFPS